MTVHTIATAHGLDLIAVNACGPESLERRRDRELEFRKSGMYDERLIERLHGRTLIGRRPSSIVWDEGEPVIEEHEKAYWTLALSQAGLLSRESAARMMSLEI